jgi:hypothetical protein
MVVASKLHKLVSSCYLCSLTLIPYDLNVLNIFFKKCNEMKKNKLEHDKKENNLTITPKWKTWNYSHAKNMMHSLETTSWIDIKLHDLSF